MHRSTLPDSKRHEKSASGIRGRSQQLALQASASYASPTRRRIAFNPRAASHGRYELYPAEPSCPGWGL